MKKIIFFLAAVFIATICFQNKVCAQQYKIRQANTMMGMKSESTVYVKGKRKRTESAGMMGMSNPTIIEQCDLQRFIKINDKKKLYFIQPFVKETDEIIDEDLKPAPAVKSKPVPSVAVPQNGGIVYTWYTITDTAERKKMYGLTARHIWTYQKMKPSADACYMKDSMVVKTDGWYIDLPEFTCPVNYRPVSATPTPVVNKPDCKDRYVTRRKGKGKLGFPLIEKRTMLMGGAGGKSSEYESSIETSEFSAAKLDSMLFEIPPGYTEVKAENDLQDQFDINQMVRDVKNANSNNNQQEIVTDKTKKRPGMIRIGVYEPKGDGQLSPPALQQDLVSSLTQGSVEAMAVASEEEAKRFNCDYTLNTSFVKFKQASKLGGIIKAVKNSDPNAASSFNIEASLTLVKLADNSTRTRQTVDGKYEGKMDDAARKALAEGSQLVLRALN
jgi:hypothetical protein